MLLRLFFLAQRCRNVTTTSLRPLTRGYNGRATRRNITSSEILPYQGAGLKYVLLRLRDGKFRGKEDWFEAHKFFSRRQRLLGLQKNFRSAQALAWNAQVFPHIEEKSSRGGCSRGVARKGVSPLRGGGGRRGHPPELPPPPKPPLD